MNLNAQSVFVAGAFPTIDHSGTINSKLDYSLYYFAAFPLVNFSKPEVSKNSYFHLLYFEQALSYNVTNRFSLTGSYLYQRENVVYNNYTNENRFYIQAKYKHPIKKVNITHRLRFDGKFVQNRLTRETPFTHRVRYLIGMDTPINEKLYVTAYEEAFINTFENAGAFYGENWAYTAVGKKLNEKNKIEAGILYVTWNIGKQNWFNQYYFQLTWISHLDFRKNS
ncbi:MAG: DUF2490 domain-containing protein [Bacteroidota bacterium]|nr:DUF2490 domain-containing protein [Bacteroidota bacterium]